MKIWPKYFTLNRIRQKLKDTSIKNKLLFTYLSVVIILSVILGMVSYNISSKTVIRQTEDYANLVITQISKDIDSYIEKFERLTYTAYSNFSVQQILSTHHEASFAEKLDNRDIIGQFILGLSVIDTNIDGVYIYSRYDDLFYGNLTSALSPAYDFKKEDWYGRVTGGKVRNLLVSPHVEKKYTNTGRKMNFSYIRRLTDISNGDYIGFINIDINVQAIQNIVGGTGEKISGRMLILNEDNRVIYISPENIRVEGTEKLKEGMLMDIDAKLSQLRAENVVITSKSQKTGWNVVFISPISQISDQVKKIRMYTLITAIFCVLLLSLISNFIAMGISRPIKRLKRTIMDVENGDLDAAVEIESNDEIGQLSKSFNKMVKNIKKLIKEVYEIQLKKKEVELNALQSQINPHFMYNTLESANMMAILAGNFDISDLLTSFANILRFNLDNKSSSISLDKEIKYVMDYVNIQKIRYKDKLNVELFTNIDVKSHVILKLIIQPIVENAICHGIAQKGTDGHIRIIINKEDGNIRIIIEDDGVGMTEQRLEDVHKSLEKEESLSKEGSIGLNNINERIKLYYGEQYGLKLTSRLGKGTAVELVIPAKPIKRMET